MVACGSHRSLSARARLLRSAFGLSEPDGDNLDEQPVDTLDRLDALLRKVARAPDVPPEPLSTKSQEQPIVAGRYVVHERLGAGGMGVVYRARDRRLDRDVALKLHRGRVREDEVRRLQREAQSMAGLNHPERGRAFAALDTHREATASLRRAVRIGTTLDTQPLITSKARFDLAQSLWKTGAHRDAREQAQTARNRVTEMNNDPEFVSRVDAWLDAH